MYQTYLPLHAQFALARLKLHLKEHPEQAQQIAIDQFTYHLELLEENRKLEKKLESVSLPSFPRLSNTRLQNEYDDLRKEYQKILNSHSRLHRENHKLKQLLSFLLMIIPIFLIFSKDFSTYETSIFPSPNSLELELSFLS